MTETGFAAESPGLDRKAVNENQAQIDRRWRAQAAPDRDGREFRNDICPHQLHDEPAEHSACRGALHLLEEALAKVASVLSRPEAGQGCP